VNNFLIIGGAVPGPKNNIVEVRLSLKKGKDKELVKAEEKRRKKKQKKANWLCSAAIKDGKK